ncbi:MAG: VOC family protein [Weeksellaceae bacterium]|nr:VOC family protein [Weeksellaceae bacterium]
MLKRIHPKLPMRDRQVTKSYYIGQLSFQEISDYDDYIILGKDEIELHFFEFKEIDPAKNYGMVYIRVDDIEELYNTLLEQGVAIHPNGKLQIKPWGQKEFSLLDPDNNLLTFGEPA